MNKLLNYLKKPYEKVNEINDFHLPAPLSDKKYQTFCGTQFFFKAITFKLIGDP